MSATERLLERNAGGRITPAACNPVLPDDLVASGLVYDVETGAVKSVVTPAPLRG